MRSEAISLGTGRGRVGGVWRWAGVLLATFALTSVGYGTPLAAARSTATIRLTPTSGPAGTTVTIRGTVPGMTAAARKNSLPTVCIGGCVNGFTETDPPISWVGPDTFVIHLKIPRTALLTGRGVIVLRDAIYSIGVTCVKPDIRGCAGVTQAAAPFRITGHAQTTRCTGKNVCAEMHVNAKRVYPGEVVRVSGWAPLSPVIGQPFGYSFVLSRHGASGGGGGQIGRPTQSLSGNFTGSFRIPALLPGLGTVGGGRYTLSLQYQFSAISGSVPRSSRGIRMMAQETSDGAGRKISFVTMFAAPTPLDIRTPPTWKTLGHLRPEATHWSQALPFAGNPITPGDFAYCVPGGIEMTQDGGSRWRLIPTAGAARRSMTTGYPIAYSDSAPLANPTCQSVALDPAHQNTIYASFAAINRTYGSMPPVYDVLYETRDSGATWEPIPVPSGYTQGEFGGVVITPEGHGRAESVAAVFGHTANNVQQGPGLATVHPVSMVTTDGGTTWHAASLNCPALTPCVRFGAMEGGIDGMGTVNVQPLLRSGDGGATWETLAWPSGSALSVISSGQSELVWLGHNRVAYVDAASQYPLRISKDGGRTWSVVSLPLPPNISAKSLISTGATPYASLMMLPDGHLLASMQVQSPGVFARWWSLAPGATHWVADNAINATSSWGRLVVSGTELLWPHVVENGPTGLVLRGLSRAPMP